MKLFKNHYLIIFLFILLLILEYSKCADCSTTYCYNNGYSCGNSGTNTCPTYCRPKYGSSGNCYTCSGISSSIYYTINPNGNCVINECIGDKIIFQSNECTFQTVTGTFNKLGDFYYIGSSPTPTNANCVNKICSCSSYFYTETINFKKKITCYTSIVSSGFSYYNYKTNELFKNGCPNGYTKMKLNYPSSGITRCSDTCEPNEYYIEYIDTANNNAIKEYCVDSCGTSSFTNYKYKYINNGVKMCLTACPSELYIKDGTDCVTLDKCNYYYSNQCYASCPTSYKYHNYDSKKCISGCNEGEYLYENSNICYKKEHCTFIDIISKKCLSSCGSPRYFHNYNSKECISGCTRNNYNYHISGQYTCYPSCSEIPGNYQYEQSGNVDNLECYTSRPNTSPAVCEVYYKKSYGIFKCSTKVDCINNLKYRYFIGIECKDSCNGYYQIEKTETIGGTTYNYINCYETLNSALGYSNYCDINRKKCWLTYPTSETYFIISEISSGKYELVKECPNFYYESALPSSTQIVNWCIDDCQTKNQYFFLGSKKCYVSCSDINKFYYDDYNECFDSCELKPGFQFSYRVTELTPQKCLDSCISTQGRYYDYDSHICQNSCAEGKYLYHRNVDSASSPSEYICYPSCIDIPEGIFAYESNDNTCHLTKPNINCPFYYKKNDGALKCATASDCYKINYKYILDIECKSKCDDNYYKLDISLPVSIDSLIWYDEVFNKCFLTPTECFNYASVYETPSISIIYYNTRVRKCWTSYQSGYFIKIIDSHKYELVESCDNYYYLNAGDGHNYCIDECYRSNPTLNLFYLRENKKCETSCTAFLKNYYDPDTHECLDTCKGNTVYPFQLQTSVPAPCKANCFTTSLPYYNYDSNICLSKCGADGSNYKYHKLNGYICYPSCSEIHDSNYIYEYFDTTNSEYICYDQNYPPLSPSGVCPFYYLKSDGTRQCQTAKECKDKNYIYLINNECRDRCDEYYKLEVSYTIASGQTAIFIQCFETITDCYNFSPTSQPIYYFEKDKRCWKQFPNGYFIKNDAIINANELVEECEKYYYVDSSNRNICTDNCKSKDLYFLNGNNKCESDCINYLKNYYDPNNKECLDSCKGRDTYKFQKKITGTISASIKCLEYCPQDSTNAINNIPFYDSDSNICLSGCGQGDSTKMYHAKDGYICYTSCTEIPTGQYLYEYDYVCYINPPTIDGIDCSVYYIKPDGTKQCSTISQCVSTMGYKYFINNECKDNCDGYYKLEKTDGTLKYTKCFASITDIIQSVAGVMAYDINNKLCWDHIPNDYYVNDKSGLKFEVVKECEFFYYQTTDTTDNSLTYNKCTRSCKGATPTGLFYIQGQKNCENDCSAFNKHYYNPNNNECVDTCKSLPNLGFAKKIDSSTLIQECISECENPSNTSPNNIYIYYDYNSNICIEKCGDDNINNLYHANGGFVCYPSCKEIPIYNYKYESLDDQSDNTKICYVDESTLPTNCPYYYMKRDGSLKCLESTDKCLEMKYNYLLGQECRSECNDYYILEDIDTTIKLIQCFKTKEDCLSYNGNSPKFYNTKLKKCWINFPNGYYINTIDATNSKYEIVKECDKYYYYFDNTHLYHYRCVEKCSESDTTHLYYYKDQKNCEESCTAFNKYYKDGYECLDTCIGWKQYYEYSDEITVSNPVTQCKVSCDSDQHYNYGTKICLNGANCDSDKYIKFADTQICYDSCTDIPGISKIYEIGTKCYEKNQISNFDTDCPFYYKKDYKTIKCVNNANDCIADGYNYLYDNECRKSCDDYYKLIDEPNIIKCFNTYDEAFIQEPDFKYYDRTLKKCWKELPENFFIKHDNNNINYEIVQTCEKYYYEKDTTNHINYCIDNCKDVSLFFIQANKKCEISCSINTINKYYFDPTNNECLDTCVGRNNLEYALSIDSLTHTPQPCIQKCPNPKYFITREENTNPSIKHYECVNNCFYSPYLYLDIKNNECRTACPNDVYFAPSSICYPKCDVANNYKYINTDTYDCVLTCPSELKNIVELGNLDGVTVYICKSSCEGTTTPYRLGDQCYSQCPNGHNYIGYNNICKEKCAEDANGEHYYPISTSSGYTIYKCVDSCAEAINPYNYYTDSKPNECIQSCTEPSLFYLASNPHECLSNCPFNFPFYDKEHNIYECKSETHCNSGVYIYFLDGVCVSLNECISNNKKFVDSRNICMDECPENEIKSRINDYDDTYKCLRNCGDKFILQLNIEDEPECVEYCPKGMNFIGKDNYCKKSCNEEDGLFYYNYGEQPVPNSETSETYIIYKCIDGCKEDYNGYKYSLVNNGNQCYQECTTSYPYLSVEENLCYDNCLKSRQNPFTLKEEKLCKDKCEINGKIYWTESKICISDCTVLSDTKIIDYNNKCVSKCDFTSTYKFELNGKCVEACDDDNKRYSLGDYKCKPRCGDGEYIINENQCVTTCNAFINPISPEEKECIASCNNVNRFYYPSQRICLDKCHDGDKVVDVLNICVSNCNELTNNKYYLYETKGESDDFSKHDICILNCPNKAPYINNDKCIDICPEDKKYFVESENNLYKICLPDCPADYPYYTITQVGLNQYYSCKADCPGYFVPNVDNLIIAKLCINDCSNNNLDGYRYKLVYEENNKSIKKCYKECPTEFKYHFDLYITDDNNCYKECPEEIHTPYHRRGDTICLKQSNLDSGYLLYDIKEWTYSISQCPNEYPFYSQTEDFHHVTICLKECNFKYYDEYTNKYYLYGYLTQYNTCVKDCSTSPLVSGKNLKNDELNKKCICENLFYIDETDFQTTCYPNSITQCKDTTAPKSPLPLHGTKQCLKTCSDNRILTPSEDECYEENTLCANMESYSYTKLITKNDGQKKCECIYKFYYNNNKKVCLAENSVCPEEKNLFIPDTLECVDSCPSTPNNNFPYRFKNFCLNHCPAGSILNPVNNICNCGEKFWFETSPGNYECLEGNCLNDYPVYVAQTKQCLKTCKGSYYKYLYDNKCYDNCDFIPNNEGMEIDSPLAQYKCDCKRPWYYYLGENKIMHCPPNDNSIKKCKDYGNKDLLYMIDSTRQCVKNCPKEYPYFFNNKCFVSCDYANELYRYNIEKVESSYECRCPNLWSIDPDDPYEADKICYEKNITECVITLDSSGKSTTYYIPSKKQCVHSRDKCPANSYKFNYICYDQCPEFTLEAKETISEDVTDNICTCNKNGFLWLEYEKYGNTYYKCGLTTCPEVFIDGEQEFVRKNLLESENKCVKSCLEDGAQNNKYLYSFRNKCVQECPGLTEKIYDDCVFYDLNDEDKIHNLDELKESANVQAKELYEKSDHLSGYLMNKYDASLQIYSINKFNSYKELAMKSNLTYIDLGSCLERIFEDNNLNDTDKILVTKYDLLSRLHKIIDESDNNNNDAQISSDNKFLINQVEYEFYLESTNEKIEGSICSPYEILISYSISFNKNKFNNYEPGYNDNNYLKLFEIGKKLHQKNPEYDTFNKDNIIYKDLCKSVELDGKDLILEDRYKYLYPNNISLCESNCTMNNTNFELERINCNCTYKEIFDFYRIDEDTNDILNDPNFAKPSQWGANGEIIKCLKEIDIKEGLLKNEAFYFSGVIMIVQLSMILASTIQGVKTIASFTKGMLSMNGIKINFDGDKKINNQGANSTNRYINNPPKRGNDNTESNEDYNNKKNVVVNKNLLLNYLPYDNMSKKDERELYINNNININNINKGIKKDYIKTKKRLELIDDNYKKTEMNSRLNTINIYPNKKAEFIPIEYNFKFFKPTDKGVWKKIRRSQIPFRIGRDTKILLEFKNNVFYHKNYLEGPFYEDQNLLEIIEESDLNGIINDNKVIKFSDNNNNDDSNNMMIRNSKNYFNNNNDLIQREEIYKSKKRIIPIIRINKDEKGKEKDFIKIRRIRPINNLNMTSEEYKKNEEEKPKVRVRASIYYLIKREHTYLRASYNLYISKLHPNNLAVILAEIFDKIYLIKIFLLLKKFDIFSIHLSLYMFYHILLLSLICGFFTTKTIKKIWEEENYPNINFYLLYGFLANVIIWIIYKIFILLLDNQDRIRTLVQKNDDDMSINTYTSKIKENNSDDISSNSNDNNQIKIKDIEGKYNQLIKKIRIQMALYYIVIIIFTVFCSLYLVSFSAFYTGTKKYAFKTYYISIIEIIIIKIVYGLSLASFRIASEANEFKGLYNLVIICDKYLA